MKILNLKLLNFRNYENLNIEFSLNNNIIIGNNGMGKTNLVEAIYVLSLTKSFRGSLDKILIKDGKNLTRISGNVLNNIKHEYQIIINTDGKTAKIDGKKQVKLSDYISKINVILFNPDDLKIIKDSPGVRRNFLNVDLSQLDFEYLNIISLYNKILKQRNAYLKTMYVNSNTSYDYLDILTEKLVSYGIIIYNKRDNFLNMVNSKIKDIFSKISGIDTLSIKYISDYDKLSKDKIIEIYKKNLQKDMLLGKTSFGIHHDDFIFNLGDYNLKDYGSEGQQKNSIIAFKLAEVEIFKTIKKETPILILDDLFSELDDEKIANILNILEDDIQTFITSTDLKNIDDKLIRNSKIFIVSDGNIEERKI